MKVSICIPTCNRPHLLREALMSCLKQTIPPYEVLVGDDSESSISEKIVLELKNQCDINLRYFKNNPSLGQAANVNSLINKVHGDKLILLHDDDLLMEDALENMAACFFHDSSIKAVYGKQFIINEKGITDEDFSEKHNDYFYRTEYYAINQLTPFEAGLVQQFPNDCYMVDATIAKEIGYRKKEEIGNAGDFDFGFRLGLAGYKMYYLDAYTAKYRITKSSVARDGTDSGYQSYEIISKTPVPNEKRSDLIDITLKRKAPIAILQALDKGKKNDAIAIFFSKWHRKNIFTLGGIRRFLMIIFSNFFISKSN